MIDWDRQEKDDPSGLIMRIKADQKIGFILNSFFDQIIIYDFQDYRENDFDLIMEFSKYLDDGWRRQFSLLLSKDMPLLYRIKFRYRTRTCNEDI